jgi:hypothetical protein
MEEVIGSIPIRSTKQPAQNQLTNLRYRPKVCRFFGASWRQFCILWSERRCLFARRFAAIAELRALTFRPAREGMDASGLTFERAAHCAASCTLRPQSLQTIAVPAPVSLPRDDRNRIGSPNPFGPSVILLPARRTAAMGRSRRQNRKEMYEFRRTPGVEQDLADLAIDLLQIH